MVNEASLQTRLREHLRNVLDDPTKILDQRLLEDCEVLLPPEIGNDQAALHDLVVQVSQLLPNLQQDPTPLAKLLTRLVEPFSFSDILALDPPVNFVAGLDVAAQPYHTLLLSLLRKASRTSKDAATLAGMPSIVQALVTLWLSTSDMAVADDAANLLVDLLRIDREPSDVAVHGVGDDADHTSRGQGLIWRRVFGDRDIYSLLFSIPSLKSNSGSLGKKEKSIAQARLMAIVPRIGLLDWNYLLWSHHEDVEREAGLQVGKEGLLDFVARYMVDYKNDVLIHMNLLQFFADLLTMIRELPSLAHYEMSPLKFLKAHKLHRRAMSFWLNPEDPDLDPVDLNFLHGPSAHYTSTYATLYPQDFLSSEDAPRILTRLSRALDLTANQWAHGQSPKHDLNVLVSLPRVALLPQQSTNNNSSTSPILLLSTKTTNPDAFHALATIFSGRPSDPTLANTETITFPQPQSHDPDILMTDDNTPPSTSPTQNTDTEPEPAAARALFLLYLAQNPTIFTNLTTHADLLALPEKALASMTLISALISARWAALPSTTLPNSTTPFQLPTEASLFPATSQAPTTPIALLLSPTHSIRATLIPWLLRPPQSFSGLVGGRGDAEGAAYKVAVAKWECLTLFRRKLGEAMVEGGGVGGKEAVGQGGDISGMRELLEVVDERMREGIWGNRGEVGGRIAAMEL